MPHRTLEFVSGSLVHLTATGFEYHYDEFLQVDRDEKKGLLKLCTTDVWRDFWKDVLVYTVTDRVSVHIHCLMARLACAG